MAKEKLNGSTKRFGPRYGRTLRKKVDKIEGMQRAKHKCPYCHVQKVKRVAAGIWSCGKCGAEFAGRAYSPGKATRKA